MNFLRRCTEKLRRFMQGRYGADELALAFIVIFITLNLVSLVYTSVILTILYVVLFVLFMYRMLSKNIAARQRENYRFLKFWNPIQSWFTRTFFRIKNSRKYKYFKCPDCKRKMKVPRGKGTIMVTCPGCGKKTKRKS